MLNKASLGLLALPLAALAAPTKRQSGMNYGVSDPNILAVQFAATLEALEYTYYQQGLTKFGASDLEAAGFSANTSTFIYDQLSVFRDDEMAHSMYLDGALEAAGLDIFWKGCNLTFESVLPDVLTYAFAARIFEQVGVGAYIGAAPLLDKSTLVSASTIATIEARHSSFLNVLNGGAYAPSPFDISLTPQAVATLVSPYIVPGSCDLASGLGITPGQYLTTTVDGGRVPGSKLNFMIDGKKQIEGFCQLITGGAAEAVVMGAEQCMIPANCTDGPLYIYLTGDETPLVNNAATMDMSSVFAGPDLIFVDTMNSSSPSWSMLLM